MTPTPKAGIPPPGTVPPVYTAVKNQVFNNGQLILVVCPLVLNKAGIEQAEMAATGAAMHLMADATGYP